MIGTCNESLPENDAKDLGEQQGNQYDNYIEIDQLKSQAVLNYLNFTF